VRILWQGFTDPATQSVYTDRLKAFLNEVADPGTEFDFRGVSPPDRYIHRLTEWRCAMQAIGNLLDAQDEGFDGVILGHFQDAGLWEARGALEIPIVGLGESSLLHACTLGATIGLVTIHPTFIAWHAEQVRQYQLGDRVVGVRAMETSVDLWMRAFGGDEAAYGEVRRRFEEEVRPLAEAGAEVIIPAGGLPALLFAEKETPEIDGAIVLNCSLVAAKQAELAVKLRRINGTGPSRAGAFARAPVEALEEFRTLVGSRAPAPS